MLGKKTIFNDISLEQVLNDDEHSLSTNSTDNYINDEIHSFRDKYQKNIDSCVTVDTHYIDFGYGKLDSSNEPCERSITVNNLTKGKIIVFWNTNETQPFSISPPHCEIPGMKNYSFRVKFTPVKN